MAAGATDAGTGVAVPVELRRERRMVCVEYPGVVRDVSKMLPTLGGEEGVSRVGVGSVRDHGDRVAALLPKGWEHPGKVRFPQPRSWGRALGWPEGGLLLLKPPVMDGPFFPGSRGRGLWGKTQKGGEESLAPRPRISLSLGIPAMQKAQLQPARMFWAVASWFHAVENRGIGRLRTVELHERRTSVMFY